MAELLVALDHVPASHDVASRVSRAPRGGGASVQRLTDSAVVAYRPGAHERG